MNVTLIPILTRLKQELTDLYGNPDDRCNIAVLGSARLVKVTS